MRLILFDIDGTLLMGRGIGRMATQRAMLEIFGSCGTLETHQFGGKTDWFTLVEVLAHEGFTSEMIGAQMALYEQALAAHMAALILEYEVQTLPGALEAVTHLHSQRDTVLGIVSGNVSTTAPIKLQAGGFDPAWFPVGAYGSEALHRNDLPALALQRAINHCQQTITPQDVTIIGDTEADIECARALGAQAIAVATGFSTREHLLAAEPDYLLDDLTTVLDILDVAV